VCGIAGILHFTEQAADPSMIRRMTEAMAHRGPDADACWVEDNIALGHRRLSIIDLSAAANQPFVDVSGRYMIVFNGEIYNYREVKQLIDDYPFHTSSDTEVLIAAYLKWGADCTRYLRGMFAFVIWDRREREIFMARDPMGVKPLYYFRNRETLLFASEARALLASGLVERKIDTDSLRDYFTYQSISGCGSVIRDVHQLEAGSWMRINPVGTEQKRYWNVAATSVDFDFSNEAGVRKRIRQLLLQSIERRLVSDVPVGAFLSGGIDSSAVAGLMAEAGSGRPNTFNISFEEKEYDESLYADQVARKFNTCHTRIVLKPTVFLDELKDALDAMDSPSGDGINSYVVSRAIRGHGMTVALSGVGGDELFAGYPFFEQYLRLRKMDWLSSLPGGFRRTLAGILSGGKGEGKRARIAQLLKLDNFSIENTYPIFRQIISPVNLEQLTSLLPPNSFMTAVQQDLVARKEAIRDLPLLSQVSVAEYLGYTQYTLLKDTDQMGMAASLEVREPFFDQDLVEFVLAVPDTWKKPIYPKSLLVESLKPLLPDEIVHRRKQGFLFPWKLWLKNELRSFCDQHIRNMADRPFVHGQQLMTAWRRFLAGDEDVRWSEIWLFVVLDYWLLKNGMECA
jgi:asparagine synthase (glutamine-hydrolysing)